VNAVVLDQVDSETLNNAKQLALEYALISKPFTYNRMRLPIRKCVENIAKGKFAESLVVSVLKRGGLTIDVDSCRTPFWLRDRRDFVFDDYEWDIKSIFLHRLPPNGRFEDCPALVPNKSPTDQWATREIRYVPNAVAGPCYLFVFFGPLTITININKSQESFLSKLCARYREVEAPSEPFRSDWFFDEFPDLDKVSMELSTSPVLAITGVATTGEWGRFVSRPPGPVLVDGVVIYRTAIENMACRSGDLPSFSGIANRKP
jgi:hypothetical protein